MNAPPEMTMSASTASRPPRRAPMRLDLSEREL
jgi:hypothetical protein